MRQAASSLDSRHCPTTAIRVVTRNQWLRRLHVGLTPVLLGYLAYDYAQRVDEVQVEVSEVGELSTLEVPVVYIPFGVVVDVNPLQVRHRGQTYNLSGRINGARAGSVVSLELEHRKPGLTVTRSHVHRLRRFKWLSAVAACLAWLALTARGSSTIRLRNL